MGKLRVLSGSEVCQILEQNGFITIRQRGSHRFLFQLSLLSFSTMSQGATPTDPWSVLDLVTHDTTYVFFQVSGTCTAGKIAGIDERSVQIMPNSENQTDATRMRKIERSDILRITDASDNIHRIVYSARSSWTDVRELQPQGYGEELLAITADGRNFDSKTVDITQTAIVFHGRQERWLLKSDLKAVYYVRSKPLTSDQEFLTEENAAYLNPKLWFGGTFLGKIRVLVYDRSKPESNTPVKCASDLEK